MPFEKGKPRHPNAGRKKGTPNERTRAERACEKLGIDPFELLGQKALEGDVPCIIQLCKHIEPPKKPVEVQIDPDKNQIKILVEDYTKK